MLCKPVKMFSFAILILFSASQISEAIINGETAEDGQFPYAVALFIKGVFHCTGSLIGSNVVITAGHCVNMSGHGPVDASHYYGIVGVVDRYSDEGKKIFFKKATPHPGFDRHPTINDISVLITKEPVAVSKNIQPICIAKKDTALNAYENATALGWGRINEGSGYRNPHHLRYVEQRILNAEKCAKVLKKEYGHKNEAFEAHNQICTEELKKDAKKGIVDGTCFGDSGGPLVSEKERKKVQIGLTSYGDAKECGKKTSVFTRVSAYIDFIEEIAGPDADICFV